jgi:hypothetical protein
MKLNPVGERNLDRSLQLENGNAEEDILLMSGNGRRWVTTNMYILFLLDAPVCSDFPNISW